MKIELPLELKTFAFTELTMVELNDTDVERMLTQIFEMAIKQGRTATNAREALTYDEKRQALAHSGKLRGFDDATGMAILDGWLRSSVVHMGRVGLRRDTEQMQYLLPSTVAVYRAGFPSRARHRKADRLVYQEMLRETVKRLPDGDPTKARVWIGDQFRASFGRGVNFSDPPKWVPTHDGKTELDISTLLTLHFLDQFESKSGVEDKKDSHRPPVPNATSPLGTDILDYIISYGSHAPPLVMSQHLAALIGLRLFQMPLRTALAARHLIQTGHRSPDMLDAPTANPLEQYVDFTGEKGSSSDLMARACVQRDLQASLQFFWDRLYLLSLRNAPAVNHIFTDPAAEPSQQFVDLVAHADDPQVVAHLEYLLSLIKRANDETDDEDAAAFLTAMAADTRPAAHRVADVLVEALRKRGYENAVKWFWSTGGIKTDVGILSGPLNVRRSWTYAPSDLLLSSLLSVIFTRAGGGAPQAEMGIAALLAQLHDRFGLLIDRPPTQMDTAENRAAASTNLEAFKYRLQLLGAFDGLSDDFSAQRVRNPLIDLSKEA